MKFRTLPEFEAEVDGLSFVYELEFKDPVLVKQLVVEFGMKVGH